MGIFVEFFENRRFKKIFFVQLLKIAYLKEFYLQYWSIRSIKLLIICPEYQPVHIVDLSDGALDPWSCLTLGNLGMPWKNDPHSFLWQLTITSNSQGLARGPSVSWESPIGAEHSWLYVNYAIAMRQRRSQTIILHQNCILVHNLISLCWIVWTIR